MNIPIIATAIYGLLALFGGIWGYTKAQSKVSLISGSVSGILLLIAAVMQFQGMMLGLIVARVVTLVLISVFAVRLIKTKKAMPGVLMVTTGVITLIILSV